MKENKTKYQTEATFINSLGMPANQEITTRYSFISVQELLSKFKQHLIESGELITRKSLVEWVDSNGLPTSKDELDFFKAFRLHLEPKPETNAVTISESDAEGYALKAYCEHSEKEGFIFSQKNGCSLDESNGYCTGFQNGYREACMWMQEQLKTK